MHDQLLRDVQKVVVHDLIVRPEADPYSVNPIR